MDTNLIITLVILAAAIVLFLSERLSVDLVALLVLLALGLSRVLTPREVFSGLSDPAVITILAIFVLANALSITGVADRMGGMIAHLGRHSELSLTVALMSAGALMSMFMNNIAVATILLPATSTVSKRSKVSLSRLLMPLAFGTLLGGMATLFTTTNILVSGIARESGFEGFGVLDFLRLGLPLAVLGITYMALIGRRLLPQSPSPERMAVTSQAASDLLHMYSLGERLFRARVPAGSYLIGKELVNSTLRERYRLNVVAIERDGGSVLAPAPDFVLQKGDIMLLEGREDEFRKLDVEPYLEILPPRVYAENDLESVSIKVIEVVLAPRSTLIGKTLAETHFREKHGMTVLAVWNGERVFRTGLADLRLSFGDALLVQGPGSQIPVLRLDPDLIVLSPEEFEEEEKPVSGKAWLAVITFAVCVVVAALGVFSVSEVMLAGALFLVVTNVMSMEQVYRVVDWRVIFLVAGMLPLGLAMTKTGATALFADALTSALGPYGPQALLFGLLMLTVLLAQALQGAAVSAVVAPIAIQAAVQIGADPRAMAMGVALATSMAFITPLGHPVNILMMGPGGYTFRDYFKVGLPLTILLVAAVMVLLPVFWPLTP